VYPEAAVHPRLGRAGLADYMCVMGWRERGDWGGCCVVFLTALFQSPYIRSLQFRSPFRVALRSYETGPSSSFQGYCRTGVVIDQDAYHAKNAKATLYRFTSVKNIATQCFEEFLSRVRGKRLDSPDGVWKNRPNWPPGTTSPNASGPLKTRERLRRMVPHRCGIGPVDARGGRHG